jgi:hypothetical protein
MSGSEPVRRADPAGVSGVSGDQDTFKNFGACGSRIATPSETALPLQLAAAPPTTPLRGTDDQPFVQIVTSVKNVSPAALSVVTGKGALMAVTSNGVVVASPERASRTKGYVYNLEPGATAEYNSAIYLRICDAASGTLPPGKYQLHALQRFIVLGEEPSRPIILVPGGPWEIEIG